MSTARHLRTVPRPYDLPDVFASLEDGMRLLNADVDDLSDREAWAEAHRVRRALAELLAHGDRALVLPPFERVSAVAWCRRRLALLDARRAS